MEIEGNLLLIFRVGLASGADAALAARRFDAPRMVWRGRPAYNWPLLLRGSLMELLKSVVAVALMSGTLTAPDAQAQSHDGTRQSLNSALADWAGDGFVSLSVAIATSCGIIWTGAAGESDLVKHIPASPRNLYGIGSISKTFVAVVVLKLVEDGKLQLDQTPAEILDPKILRDIPNASTATLQDLMNHTSGIPSWEDDPRWIREARGGDYDPARQWSGVADLEFVRKSAPLSAPGEKYAYANTNYTILGLIIEKVTGHSLAVEIRSRILNPLHLNDTYLEGYEELPESRVAHRYHYATLEYGRRAGLSRLFPRVNSDLIDVSASRLAPEWAAGGIVTTASDLARFALALRDGRLLKPESLRFMMQWRPSGEDQEVGHGLFRITRSPNLHAIGHNGAVLGFSADMDWVEERDAVIVSLSNTGSIDSGEVEHNGGGAQQFIRDALVFAANNSPPNCRRRDRSGAAASHDAPSAGRP
jgi:D-alanyl-D-alanine carboxypeptidase